MCKIISSNEFWDNMQNHCLPNNQRENGHIEFDRKYGNIQMNYFCTGLGITYSSFSANFNDDTLIEGINEDTISFLSFNRGNSVYMEDIYQNEKIKFDSNMFWCGTQYKEHKSQGIYYKNKSYNSQYITFTKELYEKLLSEQQKQYLIKPLLKYENFTINYNTKISNKQKILLKELEQIPFITNKLKEIYVESKVLDLVYTSINETQTKQFKENKIYLSAKDIECLQKAKNILLENMTTPPSLKELSRKSALNEFKLKKGFKQLFGNTVYGLLQEHRLNEAKKLLEINDININEASTLVGYKSGSHFSKIFKEHFGINPTEIRYQQKSYYYH